jgi:hypothetical protein
VQINERKSILLLHSFVCILTRSFAVTHQIYGIFTICQGVEKVSCLLFPQASQIYSLENLQPLGYPLRDTVSRQTKKETNYGIILKISV